MSGEMQEIPNYMLAVEQVPGQSTFRLLKKMLGEKDTDDQFSFKIPELSSVLSNTALLHKFFSSTSTAEVPTVSQLSQLASVPTVIQPNQPATAPIVIQPTTLRDDNKKRVPVLNVPKNDDPTFSASNPPSIAFGVKTTESPIKDPESTEKPPLLLSPPDIPDTHILIEKQFVINLCNTYQHHSKSLAYEKEITSLKAKLAAKEEEMNSVKRKNKELVEQLKLENKSKHSNMESFIQNQLSEVIKINLAKPDIQALIASKSKELQKTGTSQKRPAEQMSSDVPATKLFRPW